MLRDSSLGDRGLNNNPKETKTEVTDRGLRDRGGKRRKGDGFAMKKFKAGGKIRASPPPHLPSGNIIREDIATVKQTGACKKRRTGRTLQVKNVATEIKMQWTDEKIPFLGKP